MLIIVNSFPIKLESKTKSKLVENKPLNRVDQWSNWIFQSKQSEYFRWRLSHHLAELFTELQMEKKRLTPQQIRSLLEKGENNIQPEIRDYLLTGLKPYPYQQNKLPKSFLRFKNLDSSLEIDPELVINYLESEIIK